MPQFHLDDDVLFDYAVGSLSEPISLLAATHLTLCPPCRHKVAGFEAVGGAMLAEIAPVPLNERALITVLSTLDKTQSEIAEDVPQPDRASLPELEIPRPLQDYVGVSLDTLDWNQPTAGIRQADLAFEHVRHRATLLRIDPGRAVPRHTHDGDEWTLVLAGGFSDSNGHYTLGDVCRATPKITHAPKSDTDDPCFCLVVIDGNLRLTGLFGRLMSSFIKI